MGTLHRFELSRYREHYDLATLFETGTLRGDGAQAALDAGFEKIFSVEMIEEFFAASSERFAEQENVVILQNSSVAALDGMLPDIDTGIFFWLDAHFPGADGGLRDYNAEADESIRCPLESELEVIKTHRGDRKDVILIDDLRMYETGPFENGEMAERIRRPSGNGIDFVYRLFGDTHHIVKLYFDEGYVLLLPIDSTPKIYVRRVIRDVDGEIGRLLAQQKSNAAVDPKDPKD